MPKPVRETFGEALRDAQDGDKADSAHPLRGYMGAGVLEVTEDYDTDTYRAAYTVRFVGVVYVLHVFQKKSTHGIKTSLRDLRLVERRLRWAEQDYQRRLLRGE